jgi:site-specific DNA-methyltransferase (adenine-specific)
MKEWLRAEWTRSGLPMYLANKASGVRNAATRKYLTKCHLWYFPPPEAFDGMVAFTNKRGDQKGRPYFSLDGKRSITGEEWGKLRAKFYCDYGINNVWTEPAVRGSERVKEGRFKALHTNQKPLRLMEVAVRASTDQADVVWEPFGGLCSAAVASHRLRRKCVAAEISSAFFLAACERLANYDATP